MVMSEGQSEAASWEEVDARDDTEVYEDGDIPVQYHDHSNEWLHIPLRNYTLWLDQETARRLRDDLDRMVQDGESA